MRLSNERKLFAGVLGLALVALTVDRLVLGTGQSGGSDLGPAVAAAETIDAAPEVKAAVASRKDGARLLAAFPVAKQFALIASLAANTADGFAPPDKWQAAIGRQRVLTPNAAKADARQPDNAGESWRKSKNFTSIVKFSGGTGAAAVINGRVVKLTDDPEQGWLDGFKLTALDQAEGVAMFSDPSGEVVVTLRIAGPDGARKDQ